MRDAERYLTNKIEISAEGGTAKILVPKQIIINNTGGKVWAGTATGATKGELSKCPYILKLPGWSSFQEVWDVRLARKAGM